MFKTIRKSLKIGGVQRKITDKSPAVLKEIAKAEKEKKTELDFSEKGIIDLPEDIGAVKTLVWLNLSGNSLSTLPDEFVFLGSLLWLDLSSNKFSSLPECLFHLSSLSELNLQGNELLVLPPEIGSLVSLEKLSVAKNKLTSIPEEIGKLSLLKDLDLSANELVVVPLTLARLSKLTVLGLGKNRISVLPHELASLRRIRILDVRDNPLELPPIHIAEQGSQAILSFLRESMKGERGSANHTIAIGDGLVQGVQAKESSFNIISKNEKGEQLKTGGDLFFVEISTAIGGKRKELDVIDNTNGTYLVKFTPTTHGEHILKIQIDGAHIVGSPFVCNVTQNEGVAADECYASGAGIKGGTVGDNNSFTIHAVDKSGNPVINLEKVIKVSIHGPEGCEPQATIKPRGIGMYDVSYVATIEGDYILEITINGEHIMDSPFYMFFETLKREKNRLSSNVSGLRRPTALKLKRVSQGVDGSDSPDTSNKEEEDVPSLSNKWSGFDQMSVDDPTKVIDTLFSELLNENEGPTSIFDAANATSGNSNGKQQANESASRISLAKGIVGLITESQRALEIDKKFSLNNEDTESGLLERIQTVVELRGTLINTAVIAQDLGGRLQATTRSEEQLTQLHSSLNIEGYLSSLNSLQNLSVQIFDEVKKENRTNLSPLLEKRNQTRIDTAKILNSMLTTINAINEIRNSDSKDIMNAFPDFQPVDPEISMESAIKAHDTWQTNVLSLIGPKMEKTNKLMLELIEALKEECDVLEKNQNLFDEGPKHLATIAYAKQHHASKATTQQSEEQLLNLTTLQNHFSTAAIRMAQTPTPEQLQKFLFQIEAIQAKQKDSEKQLSVIQSQYEKLQLTEKIGSRALVALSNEITTLKKHQIALKESERAIVDKLEFLADTQYPELYIDAKNIFDRVQNLTLKSESRLSQYVGTTPVSQNTLISTSPTGEKCLLKKFPKPSPEKISYLEHLCSFLYKFNHPNLCKIHSIWEEGDHIYLEMPFYTGTTLRDWISKSITTVSISLLRSVFEKILSAISVLHQNGIAHGYLSLDSVIIAEELLNYSSITPTILGFEYALKDQKNGNKEAETENWEAPEARTSDFPLISVDIWDFANMICEAFSVSQTSAFLVPKKQYAVIPQIISRVNTKHLQPLLQQLLQRDPNRRPSANICLQHPYFTSDLSYSIDSIENNPFKGLEEISGLPHFFDTLYNQRKGVKGQLIFELDPEIPIIDSILKNMQAVQEEDILKPINFTKISQGPIVKNINSAFFEELIKSEMIVCVKENSLMGFSGGSEISTRSLLYLPNPNFTDVNSLEMLGKFLMKCIIDGYFIPPIFAPSFYKYLIGQPIHLDDLEAYNPDLALRYRFSLAEGEKEEKIQEKVKEILIDRIQVQLDAIKTGFNSFDVTKTISTLNTFDLVSICLSTNFCDSITPMAVYHSLLFSDSNDPLATSNAILNQAPKGHYVTYLLRYLESLSSYGLRLFLFFATSKPTLASGSTSLMIAQSTNKPEGPKISVHGSQNCSRSFLGQISLSETDDYHLFAYNLSSALLNAINN